MLRISIADGQARAIVIDGSEVCREARRLHGLNSLATAALGRALMGSLMLGSTLKNQGDSLTLTLNGGGPIGQVVCTARYGGFVKGLVDHPDVSVMNRADGKLNVGAAIGNDGFTTVVKDMAGLSAPYVGRVPLATGEVAEDLAWYLLKSEQTPSLVSLGVLIEPTDEVFAAGVLFQPMPGCSEHIISELESCASLLTGVSSALRDLGSLSALAHYSLTGIPFEVLSEEPVAYKCDCSRPRLERVLLSMGRDDLSSLAEKQEDTEVVCHFCDNVYRFTPNELQTLLRES